MPSNFKIGKPVPSHIPPEKVVFGPLLLFIYQESLEITPQLAEVFHNGRGVGNILSLISFEVRHVCREGEPSLRKTFYKRKMCNNCWTVSSISSRSRFLANYGAQIVDNFIADRTSGIGLHPTGIFQFASDFAPFFPAIVDIASSNSAFLIIFMIFLVFDVLYLITTIVDI